MHTWQNYQRLATNHSGKEKKEEKGADVVTLMPNSVISLVSPPSTCGKRDAFSELIMEKGCDSDPAMKALKESDEYKYKEVCTKVLEDGKYVDSGENDNLIVQKLDANPQAVGIFGYSYLEENLNHIRGIPLNGVDRKSTRLNSSH